MSAARPRARVRIETRGPAAAAVLAALHERVFAADTGERWSTGDLHAILRVPGIACLLARTGDVPCGYALLRCAADEAELLSIGVEPAFQSQGIGRQLMAAVRAHCAGLGVTRLFLEVRERNIRACRFYRRLGFAETGRRRDYYRRSCGAREDAITMSLDFAPECSSTAPQ
ncbi:MAG: ribosomal protein S18-alanine N-acetyltransferase [Rhodothalassiaceae bacterium]